MTFSVVNERFRVSLTTQGRSMPPVWRWLEVRPVSQPAESFPIRGQHGLDLVLEDVTFAESTIEVCDGRPSDMERQGTSFGGGPDATR